MSVRMRFITDNYILKPRTEPRESEASLRQSLIELFPDRAIIFDLECRELKNGQPLLEYDAVVWNKESVLFIECKSPTTYRNYRAREAQSWRDISKKIAKELGFSEYATIIVVKGCREEGVRRKGGVKVVPLERLADLEVEYEKI
ncbi:MAG TPA: hypothetical protein ENG09_05220 [Candidatus Syntrophoarchaeum butanivorans]|uniref:Uncharacterized protein n=1 Tax=Candidatus Syntropharchaeum butanivorans TaxID=1839936 RepID=A0A7C0X1D5_9EURY|nr:hypothetical protein [Candidatus Syntrophoarchaeum butanivorans]